MGFYTALGTPLDEQGTILKKSLICEINMQIHAGASGLLLLGSMGMQPSVSREACAQAAKIAVEAVSGRVPLFVGVMDNTVEGVLNRIKALEGLSVSGVVLTTPYYFCSTTDNLMNFFCTVADASPIPVYLYDLPATTKQKITIPMAIELAKHPNIRGIKTADLLMILKLKMLGIEGDGFTALYSGLDTVDVGYVNGVTRYLDGMFACTPKNAKAMQKCFAKGDREGASRHLQTILTLRDAMAGMGIFPAFTAVMNLLGMPGRFNPDLELPISEEKRETLRQMMIEAGEL